MSEPRRLRGPVLVIVGAALIAVTAAVLVSMRRPVQREADADEPRAAGSPQAGTGQPPSRPFLPQALPRPPQPATPTPAAGAVLDPPLPSPTHRVEAPPAIPPEIANEPDPAKKAELLKMHRLTTARVRASLLRHRRDVLQRSLDEARKQGTWTPERISSAERQLGEIADAVIKAEQRVEDVRREVGGDIDKGSK